MTAAEVKTMCSQMGLYFDEDHPDHISTGKIGSLAPPFMEYTLEQVPTYADGLSDYLDIKRLTLWIYSDTEECTAEEAVRSVLDAKELRYTRKPKYMEELQMWAISYSMQV